MSDLLWPLPSEYRTITTEYGAIDAEHPAGHRGLDIAAPMGVGVLAVTGGIIALAVHDGDEMGNPLNANLGSHIVLRGSDDGIDYLYCHLSQIGVRAGQMVARGAIIGLVGSTGFSTGPHLHFGQWKEGVCQRPQIEAPA